MIVIPGGGALERIAPESSPLAHRDAAATVQVLAAWHDPVDSERNEAWACAGSIALDPFSVGINVNLTGDEAPERIQTAFSADGYDRLRAIKRTYDPDDVFDATPLPGALSRRDLGAQRRSESRAAKHEQPPPERIDPVREAAKP